MTEGPLAELVVLDLTEGAGGPFCTKLLADCGALVVKVERPGRGDPARREGPFPHGLPHPEKSALFLYLNTNKRGVTLDYRCATGRRLLLALAERADCLVESAAPGALEEAGLSREEFWRANPRLLITSVSAFGRSGPWAGWRATNLTAFAAGGQMSVTGDPDREPLVNAGHQAEYQAGLSAFAATLAGLWGVAVMEIGQHVDVGAMQGMAAALEAYLPDCAYLKRDALTKRRGNLVSAVLGVYPCADGYIGVHAMPRNFPALAQAIDMPWLAEDERFRDSRARLVHNDELAAHIYAWAAECTRSEVYRRAGECRAPVAPVNTIADVLASPHLRARGYFREVDHPAAGCLTYPGAPFRMGATPLVGGRAPLLGEHNEEVYGELLGLTRRDLVRLRSAGVI